MSYPKAQKAKDLFLSGYNCAQAVLCAFCTEGNLTEEAAVRLASSFGGGMGRLREVCGAVSGMFMAAGLLYASEDPKEISNKTTHYERIQALANDFKAENGSIVCRALLGLPEGPQSPQPAPRTADYYKKRPCAELVYCAAKILEDYIKAHPPVRKI